MFMRFGHVLLSLTLWSTHLSDSSLVSGVFLSSLSVPQSNVNDNDEIDRMYMRRAIALAAQASGKTSPNPCVGCVIVVDGKVVGEGWHKKAGSAHAEANALLMAGANAAGGTAYVSLEPCNHYGRTPPCTHALIRHGVARVVAGMVDPDPRVSGYGLQYLRDNGVLVNMADPEETSACRNLNAPFVFRMQTDRAYAVVLTSINKSGFICNPLDRSKQVEHKRSKNSNSNESETFSITNDINNVDENETIDFSSILQQLSPEINAIILTSSQFLNIEPPLFVKLPKHIAIAITVSSIGNQLSDDVIKIKDRIQYVSQTRLSNVRNENDVECSENSDDINRWMILTPGVDLPAVTENENCCDHKTHLLSIKKDVKQEIKKKMQITIDQEEEFGQNIEKNGKNEKNIILYENIEMHCFEKCIRKYENKNEMENKDEHELLLPVIKQMAILGFNAVLVIVDRKERLNDCLECGICQKLLITVDDDSRRVDEINNDVLGDDLGGEMNRKKNNNFDTRNLENNFSHFDKNLNGNNNENEKQRNVIEGKEEEEKEKINEENKDEIISVKKAINKILFSIFEDQSSLIAGNWDSPGVSVDKRFPKYTTDNGVFHFVHQIEEKFSNIENEIHNYENSEISSSNLSIDINDETDFSLDNQKSQIDDNLVKSRNRKAPLKVFAIKFWS